MGKTELGGKVSYASNLKFDIRLAQLVRNLSADRSIIYAFYCKNIRFQVHSCAPEGGQMAIRLNIDYDCPLIGLAKLVRLRRKLVEGI